MTGIVRMIIPIPTKHGHPIRIYSTTVTVMMSNGNTNIFIRIGTLASSTQRSFAIRFVTFDIFYELFITKLVIFDTFA